METNRKEYLLVQRKLLLQQVSEEHDGQFVSEITALCSLPIRPRKHLELDLFQSEEDPFLSFSPCWTLVEGTEFNWRSHSISCFIHVLREHINCSPSRIGLRLAALPDH